MFTAPQLASHETSASAIIGLPDTHPYIVALQALLTNTVSPVKTLGGVPVDGSALATALPGWVQSVNTGVVVPSIPPSTVQPAQAAFVAKEVQRALTQYHANVPGCAPDGNNDAQLGTAHATQRAAALTTFDTAVGSSRIDASLIATERASMAGQMDAHVAGLLQQNAVTRSRLAQESVVRTLVEGRGTEHRNLWSCPRAHGWLLWLEGVRATADGWAVTIRIHGGQYVGANFGLQDHPFYWKLLHCSTRGHPHYWIEQPPQSGWWLPIPAWWQSDHGQLKMHAGGHDDWEAFRFEHAGGDLYRIRFIWDHEGQPLYVVAHPWRVCGDHGPTLFEIKK